MISISAADSWLRPACVFVCVYDVHVYSHFLRRCKYICKGGEREEEEEQKE